MSGRQTTRLATKVKAQGKQPDREGVILGWLLLAMALFAFLQVVMRYLFHRGFSWGEETERYLCVLLTFFGAAWGIERGSHFSMDILQRLLPEKTRFWQARIIDFLSAAIYLTVAGYGIQQIIRLQHFGSHSPALQLPMGIPYLAIPLGCGLMGLRSLRRAFWPRRVKAIPATTGGIPTNPPQPDTTRGKPQ